MNILLTNDDGYNAPGIKLLKSKLEKYGTVVIIAPDEQNSAKSMAITIGSPLYVKKIEENVFSCSGTPCDCVSFGLTNMTTHFDLVVSGCNDGWNVSYDTLYSGTVGAALQALVYRTKAIAFSVEKYFDMCDKYFDLVMAFIDKYDLLSTEYILNVNFPSGDAVRGISLGSLYYRKDRYYFVEGDGGYYARRDLQADFSDDKHSDCYQINNGIISIVPIMKTGFSNDCLENLKRKIHENR